MFNGEYNTYSQNLLDWSAPDDIAFSDPPTLIWSPQTCRTTASQSPIQVAMNSKTIGAWGGQIVFSPDGKRVVVIGFAGSGWVLDAQTGSILTKLQMSDNVGIWPGYGQAVWTDGGSQIVALTFVQQRPFPFQIAYKVQEWDSRTGAFIRTAITFPVPQNVARQVLKSLPTPLRVSRPGGR